MKDLWREIRMLIVELLITLQLWIVPKDHPHAVIFISMMEFHLKATVISIDDESEADNFGKSIVSTDQYKKEQHEKNKRFRKLVDDLETRKPK